MNQKKARQIKQQMNKPELISFSDFLMIASSFDQRSFFAPEIEYYKNGIDSLMQSGLIAEEQSSLIEYHDKVAILSIEGPLRPGKDWYFSTGYGDIQDAIVELIDSDIETVIQKIDSPGGTVKQAFETEEMFQELAKEKRLISLVTGSATSAAALMTFPAAERYLASKTAQTGSIGVVAEHIDNRAWYREFWGEVRTSVAKGELKDAGTDTRAFDAKAKAVFEEQVAKLYDIFADSAVRGLGISRDKIDEMQSRVYIGQDGINQGFAQGFATLSELIDKYNTKTISTAGFAPVFSQIQSEDKRMDTKQLKAEHLDVYQAVLDEGKKLGAEASKETFLAEGEAKGVMLERKRITGIDALNFPSEFTMKAKTEGWQPEKAALEYRNLEIEKGKAAADAIDGDLEDAVSSDVPEQPKQPESDAKDPVKEFKAAVDEKVKSGMKKSDALKAVAQANPELHRDYINALNGGDK